MPQNCKSSGGMQKEKRDLAGQFALTCHAIPTKASEQI